MLKFLNSTCAFGVNAPLASGRAILSVSAKESGKPSTACKMLKWRLPPPPAAPSARQPFPAAQRRSTSPQTPRQPGAPAQRAKPEARNAQMGALAPQAAAPRPPPPAARRGTACRRHRAVPRRARRRSAAGRARPKPDCGALQRHALERAAATEPVVHGGRRAQLPALRATAPGNGREETVSKSQAGDALSCQNTAPCAGKAERTTPSAGSCPQAALRGRQQKRALVNTAHGSGATSPSSPTRCRCV